MSISNWARGAYGREVPITADVVNASVEILRSLSPREIMPIHYRALSERAWALLMWEPDDKVSAEQSAEDLRSAAGFGRQGLGYLSEKILCHGHHDVGAVFLREWIDIDQLLLFNIDRRIQIAGLDPVDYFTSAWGLLVVRIVNSSEFVMRLSGRDVRIVVMSPDEYGKYRVRAADDARRIIVLANAYGELCGWWWDTKKSRALDPAQYRSRPLTQLFVRLNCEMYEIDYRAMQRVVGIFK